MLENNVRNPRENADSPESYDCEFNCPRNGWINFTASANDNSFHGPLIYSIIADGLAGEIAPMPEPDPQDVWNEEHQHKLQATTLSNQQYDELTTEQQAELSDVRKQLKAASYPDELPDLPDWL